MKFRAHDTFFIRKGWLSKGMKAVQTKPDVFVAKDENPMDVLGIGSNMVKALRYWLVATNLTEEAIQNKKEFRSSRILEHRFTRTTVTWKNTVHCIFCTICFPKIKRTQLHGISSSTNSICLNLQRRISFLLCRIMCP